MSQQPVAKRHWTTKPLRIVKSRPRLFACILAAIVIWWLMPGEWIGATRFLLAWNCAVSVYLVLVGHMMLGATDANIRQRARRQDEGQYTILLFSTSAAVVSLVAIVLQLAAVKDLSGLPKALHVGLAAVTIVSSFAFIHVMFTLHYAHEYYTEWRNHAAMEKSERGGLNFPGSGMPEYLDFLYFSFVIGVAAQTADVETTSRGMRVIALVHGIISFFFNTTVLALTINIAAGMI